MHTKLLGKGFLFGAFLLLASAAFAGEKATIKIFENVKVNGKTLRPGVYELAWEGTGSNVQLSVRQRGNEVTTVPATVEPTKSEASGAGYSTKQEQDGTKSVTSVFFAAKKIVLHLDQQAVNAAPQSSSTPGNN